MKIAVFSAHQFEIKIFNQLNEVYGNHITYFETRLTPETAKLATDFETVCVFTNDQLNHPVLEELKKNSTRLVALRSAGFNHVDLKSATHLGLKVVRVPAYSPHAVAEHAVALILALNRKICRAHSRVQDLNFSLDGLVGFDLYEKTVGVIGTGQIGSVFAKIMRGFGCHVLAYDQTQNQELKESADTKYVSLDELYKNSDIISLHVPLNPSTHHLLNLKAFQKMKSNAMIINTGRGSLIDTKDLIEALKNGEIGYAGLDVYEEEENIFSYDLSEKGIQDDMLARLIMFPNVLITAHQAFLTHEALHNIAETTLNNIRDFEQNLPLKNEVHGLKMEKS